MFQIQSTEILQEAGSVLYIHKLCSFCFGLKRMALEKTFVSANIYISDFLDTVNFFTHNSFFGFKQRPPTSNIFKCKFSCSILKDFTLTFLTEFYHILYRRKEVEGPWKWENFTVISETWWWDLPFTLNYPLQRLCSGIRKLVQIYRWSFLYVVLTGVVF